MASANVAAVSAFIEGAPPGELSDVVADIRALTPGDPSLVEKARPAFQKYNEEQLTTVKLPGSGQNVLISEYNSLGSGRYYDLESHCSFAFDHITQKASAVQSHVLESQHTDLITSLTKSLSTHTQEHYPTSTSGVYPTPTSDTTIAILVVSNKYSPSNFWNGRLRTTYTYHPPTTTLTGTLNIDVHYYEDGNVRLTTTKHLPATQVAASGPEIVREMARVERRYQEELNRGFGALSEGEFKALRRQLPVTRQKVEWEKVGTYRAGMEIGGVRRR